MGVRMGAVKTWRIDHGRTCEPAMATGLEMPKPMRSFSLAVEKRPSRSSSAEMPMSSNALVVGDRGIGLGSVGWSMG